MLTTAKALRTSFITVKSNSYIGGISLSCIQHCKSIPTLHAIQSHGLVVNSKASNKVG